MSFSFVEAGGFLLFLKPSGLEERMLHMTMDGPIPKGSRRKKTNRILVYLDALRAFPDGATVAELASALQLPRRVVFDQLTMMEESRHVVGMDLSPRRYRNRPSSYDYR